MEKSGSMYKVKLKKSASLKDIIKFLNNWKITVEEGTKGHKYLQRCPYVILKKITK